ncbi:spore germination protein GerPE [Sutcliffiella deserti]|uniref:spore germination protein GerPE n=1 Tax=Sutcliffiella deserti TaxID=2875501 RepID=UPI001CC193A5|nr:spore germination protein GerPE [Sutcliffiella deserti]
MRISRVNEVNVLSLAFSSYLHIGDSFHINAKNKALAVKREFPRYYGNEGSFDAYSIFSIASPMTVIDEPLCMSVKNPNPNICVDNITVNGVSSSSVLQIGSSQSIYAEARVKHIRQLIGKVPPSFPTSQKKEE